MLVFCSILYDTCIIIVIKVIIEESVMDINGSVNVNPQSATALRNDPNTSNVHHQATQVQQQTQSVDKVTTEKPVQPVAELNEDVVNARVSEHQSLASNIQVTADDAVGSLVDVRV